MLAMKLDASDLDRKFAALQQMPQLIEKAVVGAMTETVNDIHRRQTDEMKVAFDKPTPWLLKGLVKSLPYGKDRQVGGRRFGQSLANAGTYFEEFPVGRSQNDVIRPHVFGGSRRRKASEKRLQSIGAFPQGGFTIMGNGYPRNMYGNITGAVYAKMLADLGAVPTAMGAGKNKSKAAKFFVMTDEGGRPTHIAERMGDDLRTVLVFSQSVNYTPRYDFYKAGREQLAYSLPRHFDRILKRYLDRM
jgi:hypothetical protein